MTLLNSRNILRRPTITEKSTAGIEHLNAYVFQVEPHANKLQIKKAVEELFNVKVVKINIDENPSTPSRYGVRGIPTLMLFKNGEITATKVGALPKSKLYEWVEESL